MPARIFSVPARARLGVLLVLALAALGLIAMPADAATGSLCYLSPTQIVGAGHSATVTGQVMTSTTHAAEAGVPLILDSLWGGAWHPLYGRYSDVGGKSRFTFTPTATATLRMRFAGTAAYAGCVSAVHLVYLSTDPRVVAEAARHNGASYVYGATGPSSFDCSGLMLYVVARFGRTLPRTTTLQYASMSHIAKTAVLPGDLIFFGTSAAGVYHVGMYAGAGQIWHAPAPGQLVKKQAIWTSAYLVGRL